MALGYSPVGIGVGLEVDLEVKPDVELGVELGVKPEVELGVELEVELEFEPGVELGVFPDSVDSVDFAPPLLKVQSPVQSI